MKKIILILIALLNMAYASNQDRFNKPSFNCKNIKKDTTELAICKNQILSQWDVFLSRTYKFAFEKEQEKKKLKQTQRKWLKKRNRCKTDRECIEDSYVDRIQILIDSYVEQQTIPDKYIFELVEKYPIKDCSKIKRYTRISKEMVAGLRTSAVHTDVFSEEKTNQKIQECEYIKEHIWNKEAFKDIEIIQPTIKAKFFKDKKYQQFLKESIEKAPNLKVDLKYGSFRHHGGTGEFWYGNAQEEIRQYLDQDKLWEARDIGSFNRIDLNICDIRVYEGEFDGDTSNGDEVLTFSGMVTDPKRGFYAENSYMKIYNFKDKDTKFTPFYEPIKNGKLKNTLPSITSTCLNYEVPYRSKKRDYKPKKRVFAVYKKSLKNIVLVLRESEEYKSIVIELYDVKTNKFIGLTANQKGKAR